MGKYEKVRADIRKYGKLWKGLERYRKVLERYRKVWESMRRYGQI